MGRNSFMQTQAKQGFLDRFFKLSEKNTTVKTELLAGLTTFIALAYIIFVNPNILSEAGIPKEAAIASTIRWPIFNRWPSSGGTARAAISMTTTLSIPSSKTNI